MQVSKAMEYQRVPIKPRKAVGRVKRGWAVKVTTKHLDKLSTARIALYLYKRHELGLLYTAVTLVFFWAIASNM